MDNCAKGGDFAGFLQVGSLLGALEGEFPGSHVPADGKHFILGQFEAEGQQHNDGLLTVSQGKDRSSG